MDLIQWLDGLKLTHSLVDEWGGRKVLNGILGRRPLIRRLPKSGVVYRHRFIESFALAEEMFVGETYGDEDFSGVSTIADLGCNVGYFLAYAKHRLGHGNFRGLAIDANREMVHETEWLADANGIQGMIPLCGLIGSDDSRQDSDFFINDCGLISSKYPFTAPDLARASEWRRIKINTIDLELAWRGLIGDVRCNLLKVDIEGSEGDFIRVDNPFLQRVDRIVLEWHGWVIGLPEIRQRLEQIGFEFRGESARAADRGMARFSRIAA